ncbi:hypothetical protein C8J55DRAFT_193640 [Lentinula edodes]|uniref:Uncharacterized protein n=1 Tax=Lentinula lateritia TaxID=40482 RepID=A0A9W9DGN8_9AGAR|nr:hypothetical protein C8J55DRAFT_193640 [Lentinula edodes]
MRLVTSLVLMLGFVSLASAAPLDTRRPSSHIDVTIAFEENPLEGIHTHLTQSYTNAVKEDVRTLVKSIAGRDLGAPEGSALLFHWIGTPSPDTAKPVMFDISTKEHGRYRVAMSHRTPMHDVIVTDSLGRPVRKQGDRELPLASIFTPAICFDYLLTSLPKPIVFGSLVCLGHKQEY